MKNGEKPKSKYNKEEQYQMLLRCLEKKI